MKNQIYNIVHNALIINDDNSSINYNKSEVNNTFTHKITLDELCDLMIDGFDIFKYDTVNAITIIDDSWHELSLNKCTEYTQPLFIKLIPEGCTGFILSIEHLQNADKLPEKLWSNMFAQYQHNNTIGDTSDTDGYSNCIQLLDSEKHDYKCKLPAINYCNQLKYDKSIKLHGYLPTIKQLQILSSYNKILNTVLNHFYIPNFNMDDLRLWSSTEQSYTTAYTLYNQIIFKSNKIKDEKVLPFFKQIMMPNKNER